MGSQLEVGACARRQSSIPRSAVVVCCSTLSFEVRCYIRASCCTVSGVRRQAQTRRGWYNAVIADVDISQRN